MSQRDVDQLLVERVQAGDIRAFDMLVTKYQHKIVALAQKFVSVDEAQDVAQESFIKAYKALPKFRGDAAFYTWLYRITINTAKNHLMQKTRRPSTVNADFADIESAPNNEWLQDIKTPQAELEKDQLERVIMTVIQELPEDLRVAVTLREFDGLSYEDIAQIMHCPIGTVRSRIFRAREAIDLSIKNRVDDDETPRSQQTN